MGNDDALAAYVASSFSSSNTMPPRMAASGKRQYAFCPSVTTTAPNLFAGT